MMRGLIVLACVVAAGALEARADEPQRTVSVTGTAVTRVAPDIAVWHVQVNKLDMNLSEAKAASDADVQKALAVARELGVEDKDLQTGQLSISREYERDERGNQREFKGWNVRRSITIRQRDLARFEEFVDALLAQAELEVSFSFDVSNRIELQEQTRIRAVEAASAKAKAMVEAAGGRLGSIISLNENASTGGLRQLSMNNFINADASGPSGSDVESGSFAPGAIEVSISISAKYQIV